MKTDKSGSRFQRSPDVRSPEGALHERTGDLRSAPDLGECNDLVEYVVSARGLVCESRGGA